jgi:hypothetical protein
MSRSLVDLGIEPWAAMVGQAAEEQQAPYDGDPWNQMIEKYVDTRSPRPS